jgi:hypothetical protein
MTPARVPPIAAAGVVLLHRDQVRHALAVHELAADQVPGSLRSDQDDIDVGRRLDVAESDVEAVAEGQRFAGGQVRLDVRGVDVTLDVVRRQDHDEVCLGGGFGRGDHAQSLVGGLGAGLGALQQADADVHAGVTQAQRVGVALRAVTDDRDLAALDDREIGIVVVENLGCHG